MVFFLFSPSLINYILEIKMAHALHKFKLLDKKADEPAKNEPAAKPIRTQKLQLYNHIASKFENGDK